MPTNSATCFCELFTLKLCTMFWTLCRWLNCKDRKDCFSVLWIIFTYSVPPCKYKQPTNFFWTHVNKTCTPSILHGWLSTNITPSINVHIFPSCMNVFLGHQAWVFMATSRQALQMRCSSVNLIIMTAKSRQCQVVHKSQEQHKCACCLPAVPPDPCPAQSQKQGSQTSAHQGWYLVLQPP